MILTPHTAWSSARVLDRSIDLFCDNLVRFSRGEPLAQRRRPDGRLLTRALVQIAIVGLAGERQDHRLQHADPRPRRDRRLRRAHAERRRRQGARRPARPPRRDLQAEEGRPRRRHLRRPAGAAAVVRGPRRDGGAAGRAPRPAPRVRCAAPRRPGVRRPVACRIPTGSVDPARDLERLDLEFILADLAMVDRRLERLATERPPRHAGRARGQRARGGRPAAAQGRARGGPTRSATPACPTTRRRPSAASGS